MSTATLETKALDDRIAELGKALLGTTKRLDEFTGSYTLESGGLVVNEEKKAAFTQALAESKEIRGLIEGAREAKALIEFGHAPAGQSVAGAVASGDRRGQLAGVKTLADHFLESKSYIDRNMADPRITVRVEGETPEGLATKAALIGRKDLYTLSGGEVTTPAFTGGQDIGIIDRPLRQNHIRDLFPKASTSQPLIYGILETGWTNNAAQTPQRVAADGVSPATGGATDTWGRKPKSALTFSPRTWPVAIVAHLLDAHKMMLDDVPRMRNFVNNRLVDGIRYAEDVDLLTSVGGAERITGLFNTEGVQFYTGVASDRQSVQLRRAITRVLLAEYQATGIVMNPLDFEAFEIEEDDQGRLRVAVSVAVGAEKMAWRLPVVETTAMPQGKVVLGAWGMGAQIYDREQVNVTVSTENRDNFELNVVTFRCEERLAFEVSRPESFVVLDLTAFSG